MNLNGKCSVCGRKDQHFCGRPAHGDDAADRMCGGKTRYTHRQEAESVADRTRKNTPPKPGYKLNAYRCHYCRRFHVGHTAIR